MQMETAHRQYVDQTMAVVRTTLQAKINENIIMIKAELQHQLHAVKEGIGESLQAMKGQIAEV